MHLDNVFFYYNLFAHALHSISEKAINDYEKGRKVSDTKVKEKAEKDRKGNRRKRKEEKEKLSERGRGEWNERVGRRKKPESIVLV